MQQRPAVPRFVKILVNLLLLALAAWILRGIMHQFTLSELVAALRSLPGWRLLASLGLTVLSYAALVGYDFLALRYIRKHMPFRKVIVPSFVAYAVSNSAPFSIISGGGVRYRTFARLGVSARQSALIAVFDVVTYAVGLLAIGGLTFLIVPLESPKGLHSPFATIRPLGVIFLLLVGLYLGLVFMRRRGLRFFGRSFRLPSRRMALAQLGISAIDWLASSAALYVLLVTATPAPYVRFLAAFLLAQIVSLLAPVPGGLGVFDVIVLLLRPRGTRPASLVAALIGYRVVYYLLPLLAAGLLFIGMMAYGKPHEKARSSRPARR